MKIRPILRTHYLALPDGEYEAQHFCFHRSKNRDFSYGGFETFWIPKLQGIFTAKILPLPGLPSITLPSSPVCTVGLGNGIPVQTFAKILLGRSDRLHEVIDTELRGCGCKIHSRDVKDESGRQNISLSSYEGPYKIQALSEYSN